MAGSFPAPQVGSSQVWIVDQIEDGVASIEVDGKPTITIPIAGLPKGVQEGDVLRATIVQDPDEKARRLAQSARQLSKSGGGDKGNITL